MFSYNENWYILKVLVSALKKQKSKHAKWNFPHTSVDPIFAVSVANVTSVVHSTQLSRVCRVYHLEMENSQNSLHHGRQTWYGHNCNFIWPYMWPHLTIELVQMAYFKDLAMAVKALLWHPWLPSCSSDQEMHFIAGSWQCNALVTNCSNRGVIRSKPQIFCHLNPAFQAAKTSFYLV